MRARFTTFASASPALALESPAVVACAVLAMLGSTLLAGCLPSSQFACDRDSDCTGGGTCESNGACSFDDTACDSGRRFDASAGSLANTCVPEGGVSIDAGVDARSGDAPSGTCAGYTTETGGASGHRYRLISSEDTWTTVAAACAADHPGRSYLAVPRSASELAAIAELNGSNKVWLGIDDRATEGVFVAADNAAPTFLPWKRGSPSSSDNDRDCVAADSASEIIDDDCDQEYAAVCECED
jgi:hypothetical protein